MVYLMYTIAFVMTFFLAFGTGLISIILVRLVYDMGVFDFAKGSCKWIADADNAHHSTSCGYRFYSTEESGNPVTDSLTFCPHCGKKITPI